MVAVRDSTNAVPLDAVSIVLQRPLWCSPIEFKWFKFSEFNLAAQLLGKAIPGASSWRVSLTRDTYLVEFSIMQRQPQDPEFLPRRLGGYGNTLRTTLRKPSTMAGRFSRW